MTATEKTPTTVTGDHAKVVLRVKSLRAVNQLHGSFALVGEIGRPPYRAIISRPTWTFERKGDTSLAVIGSFQFVGDKGGEQEAATEAAPIIRVDGTFAAVYDIEPGDSLTDDDISAFANLNTHLNLYPYWREFVHDALGRAGMSPYLLPPFNPFKAAALRPKSGTPTPSAPAQGSSSQ